MDYKKLIEDSGYTVDTIGRYRLAALIGSSEKKARNILKLLRDNHKIEKVTVVDDPDTKWTKEVTDRGISYTLPKTRIHTKEQLLEFFQIDEREWTVSRLVVNKWEVGAKNASGDLVVEPLYQVKAFLEPRNSLDIETIKEALMDVRATFEYDSPFVEPSAESSDTGITLEISAYDAHVGKLAWADETGWDNYDTGIACAQYDLAIDTLINRCKYKLDKIVYVVGNDLMNFDTRSGSTTSGTPQDNDSRYHKVFKLVLKLVVRQIEKLRKIAPVHVIFVGGNHDNLAVSSLGYCAEIAYQSVEGVTIDNNPSSRKFWHSGVNLVMFDHGDRGKEKNKPLLLAVERPDLWSKSMHREVHEGHIHTRQMNEVMGVVSRRIPALCPPDFWHSSNDYVGNLMGAQGFLWHDEDGLIGTVEYYVKSSKLRID
jgi:hypothetical protein